MLLVVAISLTSVTTLLSQDAIVCSVQRRRVWITASNLSLLATEISFGAFLVYVNHRGNIAVQSSGNEKEVVLLVPEISLFGGLYQRSPLMLCLDALFTIVVYTARCALSAWMYPQFLITLYSDVEYRIETVKVILADNNVEEANSTYRHDQKADNTVGLPRSSSSSDKTKGEKKELPVSTPVLKVV